MHYVGYTSCCLYSIGPPDGEEQACSKHVEAYYWNKLKENSASCCFIWYGYITTRVNKTLNCEYFLFTAISKRILIYCSLFTHGCISIFNGYHLITGKNCLFVSLQYVGQSVDSDKRF